MNKFLVVIGMQKSKMDKCPKIAKKIQAWVGAHRDDYTQVISVIRTAQHDNRNMKDGLGAGVINDMVIPCDEVIEVEGYDVDFGPNRRDAEFHIIGISTGASVLCAALSMYSDGLRVKVFKDLCDDRKGLHKEAIKIMEAYMPGCVMNAM